MRRVAALLVIALLVAVVAACDRIVDLSPPSDARGPDGTTFPDAQLGDAAIEDFDATIGDSLDAAIAVD